MLKTPPYVSNKLLSRQTWSTEISNEQKKGQSSSSVTGAVNPNFLINAFWLSTSTGQHFSLETLSTRARWISQPGWLRSFRNSVSITEFVQQRAPTRSFLRYQLSQTRQNVGWLLNQISRIRSFPPVSSVDYPEQQRLWFWKRCHCWMF